jgi:dipeptidyl aminopeptidase/acylaminoacyl peptidase
MTSWTVTQTGRYKAAIEGAGITDWSPFLWTSDIQQTDYDARWTDEDPAAFRQFSAVAFANKVTTPLLILHGESDRRVPTFQGIEFFQILAARGKTVRMVTYPGSPHFPNQWEQRLNVFDEITDWLKKYKVPPTPFPPKSPPAHRIIKAALGLFVRSFGSLAADPLSANTSGSAPP